MVTNSDLVRGVLTALGWIFPKPYPERVFPTLSRAVRWIDESHPSFDEVALKASLVAGIPSAVRNGIG